MLKSCNFVGSLFSRASLSRNINHYGSSTVHSTQQNVATSLSLSFFLSLSHHSIRAQNHALHSPKLFSPSHPRLARCSNQHRGRNFNSPRRQFASVARENKGSFGCLMALLSRLYTWEAIPIHFPHRRHLFLFIFFFFLPPLFQIQTISKNNFASK